VTAGRVAAAGLGLVLAGQVAATVSHARTGDRDAVRVVGRPGVRVPGWSADAAVVAEWTPEALGWGPVYEPHRTAGGAEIGRRLALPAGRYRLALLGETLDPDPAGPPLVVAPDPAGAPVRVSPARPVPSGWEADFEVRPGERAVSLRLRGGGPILLKGLRLAVQPAGTGPV
jgi:hypothetical protein